MGVGEAHRGEDCDGRTTPSPQRQSRLPLPAGLAVMLFAAMALAALSASSENDEPEADDVLAEVRSALETIVDGDIAYSRSAESAEALADEVWTERGPQDFHDDELASDLHTMGLVSDDRTATDKHALEAAGWIYLGRR